MDLYDFLTIYMHDNGFVHEAFVIFKILKYKMLELYIRSIVMLW